MSERRQCSNGVRATQVRWTIFQWVARGLFERHRLVFLVQVVVGLLQQGLNDTPEDGGEGGAWSKIAALSGYSPEALAFLLRGLQKDDPGDPPALWLQPQNWAMVNALAENEALGFRETTFRFGGKCPALRRVVQSCHPRNGEAAPRLAGSRSEALPETVGCAVFETGSTDFSVDAICSFYPTWRIRICRSRCGFELLSAFWSKLLTMRRPRSRSTLYYPLGSERRGRRRQTG